MLFWRYCFDKAIMERDCSHITSQLFDDEDGWNCPPDPALCNDCAFLSPTVNKDVVLVDDIPRKTAPDDKRRFTFGLSELSCEEMRTSNDCLSQTTSEPSPANDFMLPPSEVVQRISAYNDGENRLSKPTSPTGKSVTEKKKKRRPVSIENEFFGVYCLISRSINKYFKNRCYIGYTVDPNRRIRQHNAGKQFGGAGKTDHRGPWDMICIIHGFPNSISALRFEWAWQNPEKSRRLRQLNLRKKAKESAFAFRIRIACHMLNSDPWKRLALTFRWLLPAEKIPFPEEVPLPPHVRIAHGLVEKTGTLIPQNDNDYEIVKPCFLCSKPITMLTELIRCTAEKCGSHFHCQCLSKNALNASKEMHCHLFPISGNCPSCKTSFLWGDLVRNQRTVIAVVSAAGKVQNGSDLIIPKNLD